jgi:hypothetical protein
MKGHKLKSIKTKTRGILYGPAKIRWPVLNIKVMTNFNLVP